MKKCPYCKQTVHGRSDKIFCSLDCKNKYNYDLRKSTKSATMDIDNYLHRNREILQTLMGTTKKITIDRDILDRTGFKYNFHTSHYLNKEGKIYWLVYDYAWMEFSDGKVLLIRKSVNN